MRNFSLTYDTKLVSYNGKGEISMQTNLQARVWQYGLWSFQAGGTTLERFLQKNQHTQRKLLNF